jgi:hypothetical protein
MGSTNPRVKIVGAYSEHDRMCAQGIEPRALRMLGQLPLSYHSTPHAGLCSWG